MQDADKRPYPPQTRIHLERRLPTDAIPVGYAALIHAHDLAVPVPRRLAAVTDKSHRTREEDGWLLFSSGYRPVPTFEDHLTFALKYEGLDLALLKRLFLATGPAAVESWVQREPTGAYARSVWYLYEWLLDERLDLPDAEGGRYVPIVDPDLQLAPEGESTSRYRVHANLPGTSDFCPLVYRTDRITDFVSQDLAARAREVIADVPRDIVARAAKFLLISDSQASHLIEDEEPQTTRIQRWARAIGQAGRHALDLDELLRLQRVVIEDTRFMKPGLREEGGFVGSHDRRTHTPIPDHISARPDDLRQLVAGMIDFDRSYSEILHPVVTAAILSFGFVYAHPFVDGNGRIHRYLIHHVLAERGFNPPGVVLPVSSVILDRLDDYRSALESYSKRLLPAIEWEVTKSFNVHVTNDTADFYRYFDATPHVEFLFECVARTIEHDLPAETRFLQNYDNFREDLEEIVEMPDHTADLLFHYLRQNGGRLSKRARTREFSPLTQSEVSRIERAYSTAFKTPASPYLGPGRKPWAAEPPSPRNPDHRH